ncbi:MAG: hypothetical protein QF535_00770, partial [Anaerolineales bacterium]|nr:hypothetical protein [Anaerolineales bacterium]
MFHPVFNNFKFKRWKHRVEANGNIIKNIDILATVSRNSSNFSLAFLDCLILTPEGVEIPRCIVIRGESIVVVPVLNCTEDNETYTLMVEQRRIFDGGYSKEFP